MASITLRNQLLPLCQFRASTMLERFCIHQPNLSPIGALLVNQPVSGSAIVHATVVTPIASRLLHDGISFGLEQNAQTVIISHAATDLAQPFWQWRIWFHAPTIAAIANSYA